GPVPQLRTLQDESKPHSTLLIPNPRLIPEPLDLPGKDRLEQSLTQVLDLRSHRLLRQIEIAGAASPKCSDLIEIPVLKGARERLAGTRPHLGRTRGDGDVSRWVFPDPEDKVF